MGSDPEQYRKLFIGGLDFRTTDDTLKKHFEQWGEVVDVVVMKDTKTKRSKGFGFITYAESSMVDASQDARPHKIDAREVETKRAIPREESGKQEANVTVKKLFVGGLRDEIEEDDLRDHFGQFGEVRNVSIVTEKGSDKKRGFGFIEYDDYDSVDKCILRKGQHNIKGRRLDVKKALSKQQMQEIQNKSAAKQGYGEGPWGDGYGGGYGSYGGGGGYGGGRGPWNDGQWGNQGGGGSGWGNQGAWGGQSGGGYGGSSWGGQGSGSWGNQGGGSSWGGQGGGGGGGSWGGQGSGGGSWGNQGGGNFGSGYQQGYGGGPMSSSGGWRNGGRY